MQNNASFSTYFYVWLINQLAVWYHHQAREQATQQKNKRSEPGTKYNTIGKITDVRVVRYDILVSSSKGASNTAGYNTNWFIQKRKIGHTAQVFFSVLLLELCLIPITGARRGRCEPWKLNKSSTALFLPLSNRQGWVARVRMSYGDIVTCPISCDCKISWLVLIKQQRSQQHRGDA